MRSETDVLVVGAGPVGLQLAADLARRRIDHLVIDQRPAPQYFVKALGVSPRTLEIWEQLGIGREALDAGLFLRGAGTLANGEVTDRTEMPEHRLPYGPFVLAQFETERILRERLLATGGQVHSGRTLVSFEAKPDLVVARVKDAAGAETDVTCRYLVGCDGAHSAVRHGLGLAYEGDAYPMTFMLGDVAVDWALPRGWAYRGVHVIDGQMRNAMATIPIPGDPRRYRISMAAPESFAAEGADLTTPPTLELLAESIAPMLPPGAVVSDLRWSSFYRVSHRIVPSYGAGRVFIAGDAAHIHPPIGGQGMNTGLQDSWNLGWKLDLATQRRAASNLLDSYSAERQPVGLAVVTRTSARMSKTIEGTDKDSVDEILIDSQLLVNYRGTRWVEEDISGKGFDGGPQPGDRAPDAAGLRRTYVDRPFRLFELLTGPGHVLLLYMDGSARPKDYEEQAATIDALRKDFGGVITAYTILSPESKPTDQERTPLLTDNEGHFARTYGTKGPALYLIRPDGYVGYRATPPNREKLNEYLKKILRAV